MEQDLGLLVVPGRVLVVAQPQLGEAEPAQRSGLCVYLKNGLNVYSILEQEPCYGPGPTLQEFYAADS
jgi:hypothetical protein